MMLIERMYRNRLTAELSVLREIENFGQRPKRR